MRKEILKVSRKNQRANLKKFLVVDNDNPILLACHDILENNMSVRGASAKNFVSPTSVQRYLNKLNEKNIESLTLKRGATKKISGDIKAELKKVLMKPPFALNCGKGLYYPYYEWHQKFLRDYLNENYGIDVTTRTCSIILKELNPYKKIISKELISNIKNIWLFMNIKVYDLPKENKERKKSDSYFVCLAYRLTPSDDKRLFRYKVSCTRTSYADFIDDIFSKHITDKSVIFFAENISNQNIREKNMNVFIKHKRKIKIVMPITLDVNRFYNEEIQSLGFNNDEAMPYGERVFDYKNIYWLFQKKLPYYIGNPDDDLDIEKEDDEDGIMLFDYFDYFSKALFQVLNKINIAVQDDNFEKIPEKIKLKIEEFFDKIWMYKII